MYDFGVSTPLEHARMECCCAMHCAQHGIVVCGSNESSKTSPFRIGRVSTQINGHSGVLVNATAHAILLKLVASGNEGPGLKVEHSGSSMVMQSCESTRTKGHMTVTMMQYCGALTAHPNRHPDWMTIQIRYTIVVLFIKPCALEITWHVLPCMHGWVVATTGAWQ